MTRSDLKAIGLETDQIQQVLDLYKGDCADLHDKYTEKATAKDEKIAELQKQLDENPGADDGQYQSKYEAEVKKNTDLQKDFDEYKNGIESAAQLDITRAAVIRQLVADGANEKAARLMINQFKLDELEIEGESGSEAVKGWESLEVVKSLKAEYADFYGDVVTKPTGTANPPKTGENKVDYQQAYKEARESNNQAEAIRIKREAFEKEGISLI